MNSLRITFSVNRLLRLLRSYHGSITLGYYTFKPVKPMISARQRYPDSHPMSLCASAGWHLWPEWSRWPWKQSQQGTWPQRQSGPHPEQRSRQQPEWVRANYAICDRGHANDGGETARESFAYGRSRQVQILTATLSLHCCSLHDRSTPKHVTQFTADVQRKQDTMHKPIKLCSMIRDKFLSTPTDKMKS